MILNVYVFYDCLCFCYSVYFVLFNCIVTYHLKYYIVQWGTWLWILCCLVHFNNYMKILINALIYSH